MKTTLEGSFKPLTPLDYSSPPGYDQLATIYPAFFVPRLEDKPQNPIVEALPLYQEALGKKHGPRHLPKELVVLSEQILLKDVADEGDMLKDEEDIWTGGKRENEGRKNQIMSWDCLRPTYNVSSAPSPFLTEQSPHIFAAARYHVCPQIHNPDEAPIHLDAETLIENLRSTLIGCSSHLHIWDPVNERFVLSGVEGVKGVVILGGMDEVVRKSFMDRFLTIGTLIRRLESLVVKLRKITSEANPSVHAFTHALSSVIVHIRSNLSELPLAPGGSLATLWLSFAQPEQDLLALASLCQRDMATAPQSYPSISQPASNLLSRIYDHLAKHVEQQSPKSVRALLAYILTVSSRPYLSGLSQSVGFGGVHNSPNAFKPSQPRREAAEPLTAEDDEDFLVDGFELDDEDSDIVDNTEMPSFLPPGFADTLERARRSLKILHIASPDHPILADLPNTKKLEWIWTTESILTLLQIGSDPRTRTLDSPSVGETDKTTGPLLAHSPGYEMRVYKPELSQFQVFDLEPGEHLHRFSSQATSLADSPENFVKNFPDCLPSITPTLPHLSYLVLSPLLEHCNSLSRTTLQIFMKPSSMHLRAHLILLRSFLLLTSHAFKSRLSAALFSDSGEYASVPDDLGARAQIRKRDKSKDGSASGVWAVGLGSGLTERETWPPGGSDLSFYLRTVIMDSLEHVCRLENGKEGSQLGSPELWEDAESRIGFAIRDLPVGTGRDKWLDPKSIEALDFLYLNYKTPRPLRSLITQDILSKYQRVFTYLLRLLRAENVMRSLFRFTRNSTEPIFQTLSKSNKLLLHFRNIGQSFVTSLSAYVYDTAIGGNFDAFLARLALSENSSVLVTSEAFTDVFSLAEYHSKVMDDILGACLLRSGQRSVGDLLRGCLEVLLDLGVLIGELKRGRIQEYQAAERLEDLYKQFQGKMMTLIKALKKLVDKGPPASHSDHAFNMPESYRKENRPQVGPGGTECLSHLLVRLDVANWWKRAGEKTT